MLQFFKYVLATVVGLGIFMMVSFFLLIGIGASMSSSESTVSIKDNSVLRLNLDADFHEIQPAEDPFDEIFNEGSTKLGLKELKEAIKKAEKDASMKGISINVNNPGIGFAALEEVAESLKSFKKSGKFIYSYSTTMSEKAVLISSLADSSFVNPVGIVEFNGLSSEITFLKGFLDKLGVEPVVFRVGEFKSAVEPYLRKDMSEENKEQVKVYQTSIANKIYGDYARNKKITKEEVDKILNTASMLSAVDAAALKIVNKVAYEDEYEQVLRKKLALKEDGKISYVSVSNYGKAKKEETSGNRDNRIAVIVSEGEIVDGKGSTGQIGSDEFVKELKRARKDKKIKAIVLRINSPGGSALASDIMWREIQLTKKEKPVIASMGNLAASGGYYMAMGCDTIVAHPTTLTGSIGIFAVLMNAEKLLNEKVGVTFDGVKSHQYADSPSMTRKMSEPEKQMVQNYVNQGYETFTSKAAEGRKMSIDALKAIAGGRVWSGEQAKENGLVDVLGGLDDAIAIAAKKAKLKEGDFITKYYPYPKSEFEKILEKINKTAEEAKIKSMLGEFAPIYSQIKSLENMKGPQARLPYVISFN